MKKILKLFIVTLSLFVSSCSKVNKKIEFLNTKDVLVVTCGKEYDSLKEFNNYYIIPSESDLASTQIDNAYRCVGINGNDVESSILTTSLFDKIEDITSKVGSCLILTGFKDYNFLDETIFAFDGGSKTNVSINKFYAFWFVSENYGYRLEEVTAMEGNSTVKFDSLLLENCIKKFLDLKRNNKYRDN